ncbi:MAG: ABC transporter permease subunit [bacterium]|nr:ABC transporter permease subunit [bacterium]
MLKAVFLREMLEAFVSRKILFICLLCCLLIPLGVLVNQRALGQFMAHQSRAKTDYQQAMRGLMPTDQIEIKAFRSKAELTGLGAGLDLAMPTSVSLRKDGMSFGVGQLLDNPITGLFGKIDLLFIVKFVLSLVAIILSFNIVCGEKEAGTLRLILSNSVPRDSVLFGKFLSALVTLITPFAVGLLISLLVLQLGGDRALATGEQWLAILGVFVVSTLYLSVFLSLGAFVSTLTSRSLTSITVLLFLWAALITVIPQSSGLLAEAIYSVESTESFLLRKHLVTQDIDRQRAAELLAHRGKPDYEELRKPVALKYAVELGRIHSQMDQEHDNRRKTQFRVASVIASLSPVTPMTFAFTSLTGTGVFQADDFQRRLGEFRERVSEEVFSEGYRDFAPGGGGVLRITTVEMAELPIFEDVKLPLSDVLRSTWEHILLLVGFNVVFFVAAYVRFRRYDVR